LPAPPRAFFSVESGRGPFDRPPSKGATFAGLLFARFFCFFLWVRL
jgi:hypothetical protein